ncbi:MAG: recombination mediator RecR [Tannerellaceae bacterium]|nr:recombination mediator RecR [Tannerellaceae bacterium]
MNLPSVLLEAAVTELSALPGIGRKTGLRLALHLLRRETGYAERLATSLLALRRDIHYCPICHNISDVDTCAICASPQRDHSLICIVESIKEVMAIENTSQYKGLYHVLGGRISPIDGIGPDSLEIESLVERVAAGGIEEVILALGTTMDGETTNFFIYKRLSDYPVLISVLAQGVSVGDEIEYADEVTLGRSILSRTRFDERFVN